MPTEEQEMTLGPRHEDKNMAAISFELKVD